MILNTAPILRKEGMNSALLKKGWLRYSSAEFSFSE